MCLAWYWWQVVPVITPRILRVNYIYCNIKTSLKVQNVELMHIDKLLIYMFLENDLSQELLEFSIGKVTLIFAKHNNFYMPWIKGSDPYCLRSVPLSVSEH